jgi:hypothetical protein
MEFQNDTLNYIYEQELSEDSNALLFEKLSQVCFIIHALLLWIHKIFPKKAQTLQ